MNAFTLNSYFVRIFDRFRQKKAKKQPKNSLKRAFQQRIVNAIFKNKPNRPTVACYVTHNYTTSYDRTSYVTHNYTTLYDRTSYYDRTSCYITSVPKKLHSEPITTVQ